MRWWVFGLVCLVGLSVSSGLRCFAAEPADAVPQWIWVSKTAGEKQQAHFRTTFEVRGQVKAAHLAATADNHLMVFLNGQRLFQHDHWPVPARENIASRLQQGTNVIAARCWNDAGPAGFLLQLSIEMADGSRQRLVSDPSWLAAETPPGSWRQVRASTAGWGKAVRLGSYGMAPWGKLPLDGGAGPVLATSPEDIRVPEGFRVERLYSVPKEIEGSWVSMTSDPRGRLIVSDQYGSLYRVTPGKDADSTRVEKLEAPIGEAQGLLYAYDSLYVMVNGNAAQGSGFYRLRDTDGDDQFDEVQLLKKLQGGGEHGPHAIRLGPDGLLYVLVGNHTKWIDDGDPLSPHRNWAEDLLLPRNPDGRGHASGRMAPGGWIARTDRDGQNWQIFCGGFRNAYDMDFSPEGELFAYDADMEWDTGAPWYRPTRVNHAVSAAEFGWRYGTGKWPEYYADSVGAVVNIGLGSPTGVCFGTAARFPERYQRALFINDWTYGKLYAVHLEPAGASYRATFETFAEGKPLPLTDVVIHSDGAMYFTIGGRRTQSGLYRVTYTGSEPTAPAELDDASPAAKSRALRKQLEAFHGQQDSRAVDLAWPHLNSSDRAIRYAARTAIEHQDPALWHDRAFSETRTNAIIQAMLAVTRTGRPEQQPNVLARLNALPFERLTEEQMLDALRVYGLAYIRLGGRDRATSADVLARLNPLFPAQSELVNRELCQVLAYLEAPGLIQRGMELLAKAPTQQDQMFYVFVLRNLSEGWTTEQRRAYFSWLSLAESKYEGGASFQRFVQQIREDAVAKLGDDEKSSLADVIEGRQQDQVVKLETTRQFIHNWQMEDLLPVLDRVESGRSFANGKLAYEAAQCFKCHRFGGQGGDTGPDITGVGNRFDARYLLESLIVPSKAVSDQYLNTTIQTADGEVITGRVIDEDEQRVLIRTDPFARQLTELAQSKIEAREPSKLSEMPQGLVNVLTTEEILDLIAYMRSGGDPRDKAFQASGKGTAGR